MKYFARQARKIGNSTMGKITAVSGFTIGSVNVSQAAVPADVTTALTTAGTDAATVGGAVLVVIVGIVAFKYLRKAL